MLVLIIELKNFTCWMFLVCLLSPGAKQLFNCPRDLIASKIIYSNYMIHINKKNVKNFFKKMKI